MSRVGRGGKVPESLMKVHGALLRVQWQRLGQSGQLRHLRRLVSAEHQRHARCIDGVRYFPDPRLQPQLRRVRLAVARRLAESGVPLGPALLRHSLPHRQWPGLARLFPAEAVRHAGSTAATAGGTA